MEAGRLKQIYEAKAEDRRERARRPFVEKIRALIRIQKLRASILKLRGKSSRVWNTDL